MQPASAGCLSTGTKEVMTFLPMSSSGAALHVVTTVLSAARGVVGITRRTPRRDMLPSLLRTGTECER